MCNNIGRSGTNVNHWLESSVDIVTLKVHKHNCRGFHNRKALVPVVFPFGRRRKGLSFSFWPIELREFTVSFSGMFCIGAHG